MSAFLKDGKADHALTTLDCTLYFCTEGYAQRFAEHMTESILAL